MKNDIWIGDQNGDFWHNNGVDWKYFQSLNFSSDRRIFWVGIWGESSENVYATGVFGDSTGYVNNSVIAHFDGTSWKISDTIRGKNIYQIYKNNADGNYYFSAQNYNALNNKTFILKYDNNHVQELTSGGVGVDDFQGLAKTSGELYFIRGRKISTYDGKNFHDVLFVTESQYDNAVQGRSPSDLFLSMKDGLAHYNGSNIEYIYKIPSNSLITNIFIFDSAVFLSVHKLGTPLTYMIRGELK